MHAASIFSDIAANRAGNAARRIRGIIETLVLDGLGDGLIGDTGSDRDTAIVEIDVMDDVEVVYTECMRIVMNSEMFLIPVAAVLNILRPVSLTPVLMAPDHLMGLANIRGQIFCMIDPGKALRLPHARKEKTTVAS